MALNSTGAAQTNLSQDGSTSLHCRHFPSPYTCARLVLRISPHQPQHLPLFPAVFHISPRSVFYDRLDMQRWSVLWVGGSCSTVLDTEAHTLEDQPSPLVRCASPVVSCRPSHRSIPNRLDRLTRYTSVVPYHASSASESAESDLTSVSMIALLHFAILTASILTSLEQEPSTADNSHQLSQPLSSHTPNNHTLRGKQPRRTQCSCSSMHALPPLRCCRQLANIESTFAMLMTFYPV